MMAFTHIIQGSLEEAYDLLGAIKNDESLLKQISKMGEILVDVYRRGNRLYLAGNGGSAADAQHLAAEMVGRFGYDRGPLPAHALTTDTSIITAIGNDYSFNEVFARSLEACLQEGDAFLAISTSGNSPNIIKALEVCVSKRGIALGLAGKDGGRMRSLCRCCIVVPSEKTARIQEMHIKIGHIICEIVEQTLFPK